MIEQFDINELRARPLGGKLLLGMKTVNFYHGDDKKNSKHLSLWRNESSQRQIRSILGVRH